MVQSEEQTDLFGAKRRADRSIWCKEKSRQIYLVQREEQTYPFGLDKDADKRRCMKETQNHLVVIGEV